MLEHLIHTNNWFQKFDVESAEQKYFHVFATKSLPTTTTTTNVEEVKVEQEKSSLESLTEQIRNVRKIIENNGEQFKSIVEEKNSLSTKSTTNFDDRLTNIESSQKTLLHLFDLLTKRVEQIEKSLQEQQTNLKSVPVPQQTKIAEPTTTKGDDDDIDLFASDDEEQSEETKKRLADYAAKKAKKEQIIAKSTIVLDVKPWDDETDLAAMEKAVRSIEADGLVWGQSKLIPVAYGVKKLQIGCVVEDDKIGTDFLEEKICEFEDFVQSIDIVSFNKI